MKINVIIKAKTTTALIVSFGLVFMMLYGLNLTLNSAEIENKIYYGVPSLLISYAALRFVFAITIFKFSLLSEKNGIFIGHYVNNVSIENFLDVSVKKIGVSEMLSFEMLFIYFKDGSVKTIPVILMSESAVVVSDRLRKFVNI